MKLYMYTTLLLKLTRALSYKAYEHLGLLCPFTDVHVMAN